MKFFVVALIGFLAGQSAAELENVSINTEGDMLEVTAEDLVKRDYDNGFKPKVYARSNNNQFGGGLYELEEQKLLLEAHNDYRKQVNPSASNMDEMIWNRSLADLAQTWSDGCLYEHPSRKTNPEYRGIGQNLYIKYHDRGGDNPPRPIIQPVTLWNNEDVDYVFELASCNAGKVCGHYTQVVWANTNEVGCGMKFCPVATTHDPRVNFPNAWLVTCNYSPGGNYRGQKPYKAGDPCSECPNGFCKNGLCSDCDPSEEGCECMLSCKNCGTLNRNTCTCTCPEGYYGVSCEEKCSDKHRYCGANPGWPKFWCHHSRLPFVDLYCPKMCGICQSADEEPQC